MRFLLIFLLAVLLLPVSYSHATEYTFEIVWAIEETADIELAGFRLYDLKQKKICETTDPSVTGMVCTVDIPGTVATYVLVSYSTDGIESDPSDPFTISFAEAAPLKPIINLTTTEQSLAVHFNATSSTGSIVKYLWDFGDGTIDDRSTTVSHTFLAAGTYTVSLTVFDENGTTAKTSQKVTLTQTSGANRAPTASLAITSPVIGTIPLMVTFDAGGSSDPEDSELAYFWEFGDGTTARGNKQTSHQYTVAGTYTATVTVTDSQGASNSTTSQPILVKVGDKEENSNATPKAFIIANKTSGPAPIVVTFSGASSTPSEQNGAITQYHWNFGDGSTGSSQEAKHTFTEPGSYIILLTVTDSLGKQAVTTKTVVVQDPAKQNIVPTLIQSYKLLILKN